MKNLKRQNNLERRQQQQRKSKLMGDDPSTIIVAPFGTYNNKKATIANQRAKVFNETSSSNNNNLNPLQTVTLSDNLEAKSDKLVLISPDNVNDNIGTRVRHRNKKLHNKYFNSELNSGHDHQQHNHHNRQINHRHNHHNNSNSTLNNRKRNQNNDFNNRIYNFDNTDNFVENKFRMGLFSEDYLPDNNNNNRRPSTHTYSTNDISMVSIDDFLALNIYSVASINGQLFCFFKIQPIRKKIQKFCILIGCFYISPLQSNNRFFAFHLIYGFYIFP
jgi:hypothetical protein